MAINENTDAPVTVDDAMTGAVKAGHPFRSLTKFAVADDSPDSPGAMPGNPARVPAAAPAQDALAQVGAEGAADALTPPVADAGSAAKAGKAAQGANAAKADKRELREALPTTRARFSGLTGNKAPATPATGADAAARAPSAPVAAIEAGQPAPQGALDVTGVGTADGVDGRAEPAQAGPPRFAALSRFCTTPLEQSDEVKAVMNAVRSLSRLISAIAYRPGSLAATGEKASALEALVLRTRTFADGVMDRVSSTGGREAPLPRWVRAALQEVAADALAAQWEAGRDAAIEPLLELTGAFVDATTVDGGELLADFARHVYHPAREPDIVTARMLVSTSKAAFVLSDAFLKLGMGADAALSHVRWLTRNMLADVRESPLAAQVPDDLRVAHMQGMLARVAALTAAELHAAGATNAVDDDVVKGCWERARQSYLQIEAMAIEAYREPSTRRDEPREKAA
jgi:hypothetical protein